VQYGCTWGAELGPAVVAALEGVAGTLRILVLPKADFSGAGGEGEAEDVLRQLGEATGKLRRLEELTLDVKGLGYYRMAQGRPRERVPRCDI
jgi:hypothetical protein